MCLNKTHSKIHITKQLSHTFPIKNGPQRGDALLSLLFIFTLEYAMRKVQGNQAGLKMNRTHQFLINDNVNSLEKTQII